MPLQLSRLNEADIPKFLEIDDLVMGDHPYAKAMLSDGQPRKDLISQFVHEKFNGDGDVFLKVVDSETDELVAGAVWHFQLGPAAKIDMKFMEELPGEDGLPFLAVIGLRVMEFNAEFIGTQPNASLYILFTHPQHRRRGAASMLVKWGCDKADEYGIISSLHATPEAFQLYLKHDFVLVEERELDFRPWGVQETIVNRGMIRQPHQAV